MVTTRILKSAYTRDYRTEGLVYNQELSETTVNPKLACTARLRLSPDSQTKKLFMLNQRLEIDLLRIFTQSGELRLTDAMVKSSPL